MKPILTFAAGLIMIIILNSCSSGVMNRNEAERSLKVLNSDIINLLEKSSETPEYKALEFLISQPGSPLPIKKSVHNRITFSGFNFYENCGEYLWNSAENSFIKTGENKNIL